MQPYKRAGPNVYGGFRQGSLPIPRKVTAVCLVASSCSTQDTGRLPSKRERNASTLVESKIKANDRAISERSSACGGPRVRILLLPAAGAVSAPVTIILFGGYCGDVILENVDPSTVRGNPVYQCCIYENNNGPSGETSTILGGLSG